MKSITISSFLLFFCALQFHAQTNLFKGLKIHSEFKTDDREIPDQFVGSTSKGYYFLYS
ncbi:hypothetical protein [Aquimarina agarivorans]|uniref:hypothetical protein n=1 Tax=Aquimarina agarivorans TaxID=980584 RepID=UPI0002F47158|nr:hypothetical protein [Aquimarina agarivorans]